MEEIFLILFYNKLAVDVFNILISCCGTVNYRNKSKKKYLAINSNVSRLRYFV